MWLNCFVVVFVWKKQTQEREKLESAEDWAIKVKE